MAIRPSKYGRAGEVKSLPMVTFVAIVKLTIAGMTAKRVRNLAIRKSGTKVSMIVAE